MNFGSRPKTTKLDHKKSTKETPKKKHTHTQLKQTETTKKNTKKNTNFKTDQIHYVKRHKKDHKKSTTESRKKHKKQHKKKHKKSTTELAWKLTKTDSA